MSPLPPRVLRVVFAALVCAISLLAVPTLASAATVRVDGTRLIYESVAGEINRPSVSPSSSGVANEYDVTDFGGSEEPPHLQHGAGCKESSNQFMVGDHVICTIPGLTGIDVTLGDQDDTYTGYSAIPDTVETIIDLGPGTNGVDDQSGGVTEVTGGPGTDDVNTYGGKDVISTAGGSDDVNSGPGDDEIHLGSGTEDYAFGSDGVDEIHGEDGVDNLRGADGADLIYGGPGNDDIAGEMGTDQMWGDAGNDTLTDDASTDEYANGDILRGGAGIDTVNYASWRLGTNGSTLAITLDGVANDGQDDNQDGNAEEDDNVGPDGDIEVVRAGSGDDILVGSDRPERIEGGGGVDSIDGLGAGDELDGGVGDDLILGGAGDDDIEGSSNKDRLFGEAGNDSISGASGDDGIDGGAGLDTIDAGGENDVVLAQDGEVDQIGCGIGGDVAEVDYNDVVNSDPGSLCETVRSTAAPNTNTNTGTGGGGTGTGAGGGTGTGAGGGTGTPSALPTAPPGTGNPNAPQAAGIAAAAGQRLGVIVRTGVLTLEGTAPGPGTFTTTAQIDRTAARKARIAAKKWVKIGSGRATAGAAGKVSVPVKLTSKARKRLKGVKRLKVRLVTQFKAADGTVWKTTRTITLKK